MVGSGINVAVAVVPADDPAEENVPASLGQTAAAVQEAVARTQAGVAAVQASTGSKRGTRTAGSEPASKRNKKSGAGVTAAVDSAAEAGTSAPRARFVNPKTGRKVKHEQDKSQRWDAVYHRERRALGHNTRLAMCEKFGWPEECKVERNFYHRLWEHFQLCESSCSSDEQSSFKRETQVDVNNSQTQQNTRTHT